MTKSFKVFTDQFFWNFKRMDNVNYNFEILEKLYQAKSILHGDEYFNKPIITQIVSIIECCLFDFTERIKGRVHDPLPNVDSSKESFFKKSKDTDEFRKIIARIESQNLLQIPKSDNLYKDLDYVRKVRNRIHIQNSRNELDYNKYKDEFSVYTESALLKSQECFERVIDFLSNSSPRWGKPPIPMSEFPRPWL